MERVIGLRKFGGAGLSALWTPKNFNPLVGGSHPIIMHQRSPRSTHPNKLTINAGGQHEAELGGQKKAPEFLPRPDHFGAWGTSAGCHLNVYIAATSAASMNVHCALERSSIVRRRRDERGTLRLPSSHAPRARADRPCSLLRLILRGCGNGPSWSWVPRQIEHVDLAAAELTFLKSVGLAHRRLDPVASLDVLDARSGVTLGVLPTPVPKTIVSVSTVIGMSVSTVVNGGVSAVVAIAGSVIPISRAVSVCARS